VASLGRNSTVTSWHTAAAPGGGAVPAIVRLSPPVTKKGASAPPVIVTRSGASPVLQTWMVFRARGSSARGLR
jgi:hypothetical protein